MLSHGSPYGVPYSLVSSVGFVNAPREEKTLVGALIETFDNANSHGSMASHRYTCNICNLHSTHIKPMVVTWVPTTKQERKAIIVNFHM
jgi:hypothetical protein